MRSRDDWGRFAREDDDEIHPSIHGSSVHGSSDKDFPSDEVIREEPEDWAPPGLLDAPPPRPGMVQRWVRAKKGQQDEYVNLHRKTMAGWRPRDVNTVPGDFHPPTMQHGEHGTVIAVEGMILCEMPIERYRQRERYYKRKLNQQTEAIDQQLLKAQEGGHPILKQHQTKVSVGQRRPNVAGDN